MQIDLQSYLLSQLFAFLLIFARVGSGIMLMPGVGESYVSPRIRLLLALAVALVMTPALMDSMPPVPTNPFALLVLIGKEMIIGLFMGFLARLLLAAMHIAGMIISSQSSLSAAALFDITQASQGSAIGNFMSLSAVVLLFAADLHHPLFAALFQSYQIFIPGGPLPLGEFSTHLSRMTGDVFVMGLQLSAPILVVSVLLYLGAGVLSRLMPNMQVFFILTPPQVLISLVIFMVCFSGMMLWYLDFFQQQVMGLAGVEG